MNMKRFVCPSRLSQCKALDFDSVGQHESILAMLSLPEACGLENWHCVENCLYSLAQISTISRWRLFRRIGGGVQVQDCPKDPSTTTVPEQTQTS